MKISCLKSKDDIKSFRIFKNLGIEIFNVDELENTDKKITELIENNYNTIIVSSQVANFSNDIITKYNKQKNINIIIAPNMNNYEKNGNNFIK